MHPNILPSSLTPYPHRYYYHCVTEDATMPMLAAALSTPSATVLLITLGITAVIALGGYALLKWSEG